MKGYVVYVVLAAVLIAATNSSKADAEMKHIEDGRFRVHYSGDSRKIAERLMEITKRSYPILKDIFRADHDLGLEIYWADNADWSNIPSCRHKGNYGMPHMVEGEDHTHVVILPAANVDMPETLVQIIAPLLDARELSEGDLNTLKKWLCPASANMREDLLKYLSAPELYVDFLIEIVHIHEMTHDFCYEFGIPENYGRDERKAWWLFEGLAQWSVLWVQRRLGNERWADIHELLYRWMYRTGKNQQGNISPVQYENYAWFHGALVEMFCQLEERFGKNYGLAVLKSILEEMKDKDYLGDREIVRIFSNVTEQDLSQWFRTQWQIE
jgi:hypothetical protein